MTPFAPLEGVVVLDLSRYLPGPMLTRILCDLGATVFKIEPPSGDTLRWLPPYVDGLNAGFGALHAGKRSVVIDLKRPGGADLVLAMAAQADVLVESNRPGVLDRLGLGWERLHAANPRLILASLSGYGQRASNRDAAGHDINYLARAGILAAQGPAGEAPVAPAVQVADVGGGSLPAAIAVLGALLERQRTGVGRHLDLALTRGALAFGALSLAAAAAGVGEPRGGGLLNGGSPCYRCYLTADGGAVAVGALEQGFWKNLCEVLGRPDLIPAQFAAGAEGAAAVAELSRVFASKTRAEWAALLEGRDACAEVVRTPEEVLADADFADQLVFVDGHLVVRPELGVPGALGTPGPVPALGAHLDEAIQWFKLSDAQVEAARAAIHLEPTDHRPR